MDTSVSEIGLDDLSIYLISQAQRIVGYTKFHRMAFLIYKEFEGELGQKKTEAIFDSKLFGGPYSVELNNILEVLGNEEYIGNFDIPTEKKSQIFTHELSARQLGISSASWIKEELNEKLGVDKRKRLDSLIQTLNKMTIAELDDEIEKKYPGTVKKEYISIDSLPEDIAGLIKEGLGGVE